MTLADSAPPARGLLATGAARKLQAVSITAIVENDTIKLPIHVPDGTSVEVWLPGERGKIPGEQTTPEALNVFRRLQREIGLTAEAASDWKNRVADARR